MRNFLTQLTVNSFFLKTNVTLFLLIFTLVSVHSTINDDSLEYFQDETNLSTRHAFTSSKKHVPLESELDVRDKFHKKAISQRSGDTQFRMDLFISPYSESLNTQFGNTAFFHPIDEYFIAFIIADDVLSRAPPLVL